MPYKLVATVDDGKPIVYEHLNRRTILSRASGLATSPGLFGDQDVEVIGLKGERILDSSIRRSDTHYLAWRNDRRISIRGFSSQAEAEEAMRDLPSDVEATVRPVRASLEWIDEAAKAGPGRSGRA